MKKSEKKYELKSSDVAALIGDVRSSTVRRWAAKKIIPHLRIGAKTLRFDKAEVLEWVSRLTVQPKNVKS